jgi:rhodanese-related sulfurtransferase
MELNLAQFLELSKEDSVQIIDTRTDVEFLQGYIPGSIHIGLDEIKTVNAKTEVTVTLSNKHYPTQKEWNEKIIFINQNFV